MKTVYEYLIGLADPESSVSAFRRDAPIVSPGDALGILKTGSLKVLRRGEAGSEVLLTVHCTPSVIGYATLFSDPSAPPPTVMRAAEDCRLCWISGTVIREKMQSDPAFCEALVAELSRKIRFLNRKIAVFTAGSAEEKLLLYLEENAAADGLVCQTGSMSALAARLGIGRASLYRAVESAEKEGLIKREGDRFRLITKGFHA